MPVAFHVVARSSGVLDPWVNDPGGGVGSEVFSFAFLALDVMAAFTSMMTRGLFETYPRLRCAVLEAGSNWITAWLDRLDHKSEVMRPFSKMKLLPSEYFKRQCLIAAEPDESITAKVVEHLGDDFVIWASDYPHSASSFPDSVKQLEERADLDESIKAPLFATNAARLYDLPPPSAA